MAFSELLKKIGTSISKWFPAKKEVPPPSPPPVESQPKTFTNPGPQGPGLDCPRCAYRIATTIEMLLSGQPIYCKACALKISINYEESKDCLDEVKKLHTAVTKVEKLKADVGRK